MKSLLIILFLIVAGQLAYSQTNVEFQPAFRSVLKACQIDFSWTNKLKVTQVQSFPISGYMNPDPMISPYFSTNKPDFILFANGSVILQFPFRPADPKWNYPDNFILSFHISQLGYLRDKFEMFQTYRRTMAERHVFSISLPLGEVIPHPVVRPDPIDMDLTHYFRFNIHVAADEKATLLVEMGEQHGTNGKPDNFSLHILDESQANEVLEMLKTMPTPMWWGQKVIGMIPSSQKK